MREIKFRGKVIDHDYWFIGDLHRLLDGTCCIWFSTDGVADKRQGMSGQNPVHPESVGQYTGLKDKNGVEIYEGDVVRLKFRDGLDRYSYELGVVQWHEQSSAFKWFALDEDPSDGNNYWLTQADVDWREVIGNIYESPELIKEVK